MAQDSSNAEYLKLFCMFYPPNILSNRLQGLRTCTLLPDSKVKARAGLAAVRANVTCTIPAGVQGGEVFEIRGRGMPPVNGGSRGSLRVAVQVVTPSRLSAEQRAILEQLHEITEEPELKDEAESWWDHLLNLVS